MLHSPLLNFGYTASNVTFCSLKLQLSLQLPRQQANLRAVTVRAAPTATGAELLQRLEQLEQENKRLKQELAKLAAETTVKAVGGAAAAVAAVGAVAAATEVREASPTTSNAGATGTDAFLVSHPCQGLPAAVYFICGANNQQQTQLTCSTAPSGFSIGWGEVREGRTQTLHPEAAICTRITVGYKLQPAPDTGPSTCWSSAAAVVRPAVCVSNLS